MRFDLAWLAPLCLEGVESISGFIAAPMAKHGARATLAELGSRLNLPTPGLEGELEGYPLEFAAGSTRSRRRRAGLVM